MEPVPVQDIDRVNSSANTRAVTGPELRTIFLGMEKRDELLYSNVKGKNPSRTGACARPSIRPSTSKASRRP